MTSPEALARVFDPRRPWTLDLRQLQLRPEPVRGTFEFVAQDRIGGEMLGVQAGAAVTLTVELFEIDAGVDVSAEVRAPVVGQCVRCLERFADQTQASLHEFFNYSPVPDDEEALLVIGGKADLEQSVIDAVVLGLPLAPVCAPDCRGLCAECGVLLETVPEDHGHERTDPRWAGLRERFWTGGHGSETDGDHA